MARFEVIESKVWKRDDGATASIYGALPWVSEREKLRWKMITRGYTIRDNERGTVGVGRQPWKTRAEAQAWIDKEEARLAEARAWAKKPAAHATKKSKRRAGRREYGVEDDGGHMLVEPRPGTKASVRGEARRIADQRGTSVYLFEVGEDPSDGTRIVVDREEVQPRSSVRHATKKSPEPCVDVVFRVFPEGDVIAIFPSEDYGRGQVMSYLHVGQHGGASRELIRELRPASREEYAPLLSELRSIGYCLRVRA